MRNDITSWTATYVANRERVLGRRTRVNHFDPALGAEELYRDAGPAFCERFIDELIAMLERERQKSGRLINTGGDDAGRN